MIKEKFLKFLLWFKDHFSFLLEVVVRLAVGEDKEISKPSDNRGSNPAHEESKTEKGDSYEN